MKNVISRRDVVGGTPWTHMRTMRQRSYGGQPKNRTIDFNFILRVLNIMVAVATVLQLRTVSSALYTDRITVGLGLVLAAETHLALVAERRRSTPLILLAALITIGFFSFRIVTLSAYSFSTALGRFGCTPTHFNAGLAFVIVANAALYAGILLQQTSPVGKHQAAWRPTSPGRVGLFLGFALFMMYGPVPSTFWLTSILRSLFTQNFVVGSILTYILISGRALPPLYRVALPGLLILEATLHLLVGSRGSIYTLVICYICAGLAVFRELKWARKQITFGAVGALLVAPVALESYEVATNIRYQKTAGELSVKESLKVADQYITSTGNDSLEEKLIAIFDRLGYIDYSVDLIANRDRYRSVVNPMGYVKSLVDNLLTPGFDIFDQPRISNALRSAYEGGMIKKSEVTEMYHTDQLGLHGELFVLFGYSAVFVFFAVGYIAQLVYYKLEFKNSFSSAIWKYVFLVSFFSMFNSYGLDWVLIDGLVLVLCVWPSERFIYVGVELNKKLSAGPDSQLINRRLAQ